MEEHNRVKGDGDVDDESEVPEAQGLWAEWLGSALYDMLYDVMFVFRALLNKQVQVAVCSTQFVCLIVLCLEVSPRKRLLRF